MVTTSKKGRLWVVNTQLIPEEQAVRLLRVLVVTAPGGAVHSGAFVLVDAQHHIRGIYDGTSPQETDRLLRELPLLLAEPPAGSPR